MQHGVVRGQKSAWSLFEGSIGDPHLMLELLRLLLAVVVLGDRLSVVQVLGGLLVLLAVVVIQSARLWRPGGA